LGVPVLIDFNEWKSLGDRKGLIAFRLKANYAILAPQ